VERQYCGLRLSDQPADACYGSRIVKPRHDPAIAFELDFKFLAPIAHGSPLGEAGANALSVTETSRGNSVMT
jgi:hypothetical protein